MKPVFGCLLLAVAIGHISAIPFDDRLFGAQLKDGETGAVPVMTKFRLPTDLKPTGYEVHVDPDLAKAEFAGTVKITLTASHSTSFITLNAKYIKLPSAVPVAVTRINTNRPTSTIPVKSSVLDEANEQLIIELDRALSPKSTYVVQIAYTGRLGSDMSGFYLSRYTNSSGAEKLLASTQFEPTGARRAFPCFDEPNYKTPFVIKINRHRHQKAISNMPVSTSVEIANSDKVTDTFQLSPPMPTYLVGFAVFEFNSLSDKDGKFRVWGREDVVKTQGQYIFDKGPKILAALSDYMGIDYYKMLPKMDLVAVPDFDAGAMENWGMNTYREKFLLTSKGQCTTADFQRATSVVTHEFTHQWFGDLVTPASWNFVWLNEAFARLFEYFGTRMVYLFLDPSRTKKTRIDDVVSTVTHEFSHQWFGDLVTPATWNSAWLNEAFATFFEYAGTHWACLFWLPSEVKAAQTLNIVGTVAHEFSHQWFGDLLTPYKWDYAWLKESFATFFGCFYSMDVAFPLFILPLSMSLVLFLPPVSMLCSSELYGLADSNRTTAAGLLENFGLVAHELAHQWFGNYATPSWWSYAWLKESVATLFEYYVVSWVEPTWRMEDLFVVEQVQVAFNSDLKGSHAMTSETTTPDSISETFDHIIYNKGGSVLRMIENVLTPTVFQNALQDYLRSGADLGGTVEPANLWDAFDEVLTEIGGAQYLPPKSTSITEFVDQWVNKPGFPLVTFSRNYSSKVVTVTQQRFLVEKADRDADKTNWTIPLTYTTRTNANFSSRANLFWFDRFKPSVQFSVPDNNDWLIANLKEVGFYRVNYDAQNWALIAAQLSANPAKIHLLNRAQILDDAFTLARADLVSYETALELTRYLKTEKDFIPWYAVWSHIRDLLHTYAQTEVANQMKTYFIDRLEGIFNELGLEDKSTEENMSKLGRSSISLWICNLGHSGCYNQAVDKFRAWIRAPEKTNIPPNIKDAVYCMGIKYGSGAEWTRLWQYYLTTDLASEKIAVMYALGCSQNETVLYDYLSKITDTKSGIRSQDHYIVIRGVLGERPGLRAGLKFLKDKTHSLLEEVKKDELSNAGENLKSIISTVGAGISSKDELNQFTSILTGYQSNPTIGASINKTLTHIQERFTRSANHQKALEKWFGANTPSTTPSPTTPSQSPLPTHPTSHPTHATTQKPSGATGLRQFAPSVMVATALVVLVRFGQS
ncbi:hypothetical protein M8J77_016879 [Diaphorina citri]|nr:hypothetical protein M8J77_016879 [Diaphorina citri]